VGWTDQRRDQRNLFLQTRSLFDSTYRSQLAKRRPSGHELASTDMDKLTHLPSNPTSRTMTRPLVLGDRFQAE
jgi:hypothetical protein